MTVDRGFVDFSGPFGHFVDFEPVSEKVCDLAGCCELFRVIG